MKSTRSRGGRQAHGITVRGYRRSDLAACRRLWKELTEKHREIYDDPGIGGDDPGRYFDEHLKRVGSKRLWVATEGLKVVGLVGLMVEGEDAEMEPLVVASGKRGCGIGRMLFHEVAEAAKRIEGVKYLMVRPTVRNEEAMAFFRYQGLTNVGRIELFTDFEGKKWKEGLNIHGLEYRF